MICPHCGKKISDYSVKCPNCGGNPKEAASAEELKKSEEKVRIKNKTNKNMELICSIILLSVSIVWPYLSVAVFKFGYNKTIDFILYFILACLGIAVMITSKSYYVLKNNIALYIVSAVAVILDILLTRALNTAMIGGMVFSPMNPLLMWVYISQVAHCIVLVVGIILLFAGVKKTRV